MSTKVKKFLWTFGKLVLLPVPIILGMQQFFVGTFDSVTTLLYFILFLVSWLTFGFAVVSAKYLSKRAKSIPRLVGTVLFSVLVGFTTHLLGMMLFDNIHNPPSNTGWGGVFAGFMFLGFILSVFIFTFLAVLAVVIRQGSKNALYTERTEYILYGLVVLIGVVAFSPLFL